MLKDYFNNPNVDSEIIKYISNYSNKNIDGLTIIQYDLMGLTNRKI